MLKYTNENGVSITFEENSYRLLNLEGVGGATTNVQTQKAPFQDGVTHIDTVLDPRYINIEFMLLGSDISGMRRNICNIINPKVGGTLYYTNDDATYRVEVYVDLSPLFLGGASNIGKGWQRGALTFIAPEPFWKSAAKVANITSLFSVDNEGDVATPAEIIFAAEGVDLVNPKITRYGTSHSEDGEYIELAYTIPNGDSVYINTVFGKKEITLISTEVSLLNKLTSGSTLFNLNVGTNDLVVIASSGTPAGEIRWRNKYLGV